MAQKIYTNQLIAINLDTGELGWDHGAGIKKIFISYKRKEQNQKNLLFKGGFLLSIPELTVGS